MYRNLSAVVCRQNNDDIASEEGRLKQYFLSNLVIEERKAKRLRCSCPTLCRLHSIKRSLALRCASNYLSSHIFSKKEEHTLYLKSKRYVHLHRNAFNKLTEAKQNLFCRLFRCFFNLAITHERLLKPTFECLPVGLECLLSFKGNQLCWLNVKMSLHKNRRTTLERIEKFISRLYFTDVNLYGRIYPTQEPVGKKTYTFKKLLIVIWCWRVFILRLKVTYCFFRCFTLALTCW